MILAILAAGCGKVKPDARLFYRLGDFYERSEQDAEIAARQLKLALAQELSTLPQRLEAACNSSLDTANLTPVQALVALHEWRGWLRRVPLDRR